MPLDQLRLDGAKSELAYFTASSQSTISRAAATSFVNQALKGIPQSYQRDLLAKARVSSSWILYVHDHRADYVGSFQNVTLEEVNGVIRKYILPIFDSATSIAALTSSKGKAAEMKMQLEGIGFEVDLLDISKAEDDDASESGDESSEGSESGSDDESSSGEKSGSTESWQMEGDDVKMQ